MKYVPVCSPAHRAKGFTLIEVMITVAIIGILTAIALPSYRDYMLRGKLVDATSGLSSMRSEMERYFQDNRTYATVNTLETRLVSPCERAASSRTFGEFVVSCQGAGAPSAAGYILSAVGSNSTAGFEFRVTQTNAQSTETTVSGWTATATNTCWVVKRVQTC